MKFIATLLSYTILRLSDVMGERKILLSQTVLYVPAGFV